MTYLNLRGLHHLKIPVTDVEASVAWFERAFDTKTVARLKHREKDRVLYAEMIMLNAVPSPVELKHTAKAVAVYDPFTFEVEDKTALDGWLQHFNATGIEHKPVVTGYIGHVTGVDKRDGLALRIYGPARRLRKRRVPYGKGEHRRAILMDAADGAGPMQVTLQEIMPDEPIPTPTRKQILSDPMSQASWSGGTNAYTFLLTDKHMNGKFALFDNFFPPKGHVGPHRHGQEATLYVSNGELTVFSTDDRHVLSTALNILAWAPHVLRDKNWTAVKIFLTTALAELELQFKEIGKGVVGWDSAPPPMSGQKDAKYPELTKVSTERHLAGMLPPDKLEHLLTDADREV